MGRVQAGFMHTPSVVLPRASQTLRRALLALSFTGATTLTALAPSLATAAAPAQQRDQVAGYYRMMLGDFEVTALYDGYVAAPPTNLKGVSEKELKGLLARGLLDSKPTVDIPISAFLINTGEHLILVDAGTANAFGPTVGMLPKNLRAAGYDPGQVDLIFITHMHPDHLRGLLGEDGKSLFPNAEVRVAKADADYWLDDKNAAKAPADRQPMFKLAQEAAAPYQAAGKFKPFAPGETLASGVTVVPTAGHTPGSSAYLFQSKGENLLVWGDIVHCAAVQFPRPDITINFDVDSKQAVATRKKLFADLAKNKTWVAAAHIAFPGLGRLRTEGSGYVWVPVEYGPVQAGR